MKADPGTAVFNIFLKCLSLFKDFGAGIQENYELVFWKECGIEIVPIAAGVVGETLFSGDFVKPIIGFVYKTYMCTVVFGGEKSNDFRFLQNVNRGNRQNNRIWEIFFKGNFLNKIT